MEKEEIMQTALEELKKSIMNIDRNAVHSVLPRVIHEHDLPEIFSKAVYPALDHVRNIYRQQKTGIPEVLMSLNIVGGILEKISEKSPMPCREQSVLIGVIEGDIHDMGKNIVRDVYRGYGFNVIDMGKNVSAERFVETAVQEKPAVVGLSSMMSTTVDNIGLAIEALKKELPETKIMVGGAFMNPDLAKRLQADGYAENASTLIEETDRLFS